LEKEILAIALQALEMHMQIAMKQQDAAIMAGTLTALSLIAFVCDRQGAVTAMTPSGQSMLSKGGMLKLKNGLLTTACPLAAKELSNAILKAAGGSVKFGTSPSSTVIIRDKNAEPSALQILAIPECDLSSAFESCALVIVNGARSGGDNIRLALAAAYGLTSAEVDVAVRLAEGQIPERIALERKASVGTVRTQIRSIYEKFGVNRFSEFVGRVGLLR
jgi:DNA-binding CsgD family transcriptional regulator